MLCSVLVGRPMLAAAAFQGGFCQLADGLWTLSITMISVVGQFAN